MTGSPTSRRNRAASARFAPGSARHPTPAARRSDAGMRFSSVERAAALALRCRVELKNARTSSAGNAPGFSFGLMNPNPFETWR